MNAKKINIENLKSLYIEATEFRSGHYSVTTWGVICIVMHVNAMWE